MIYVLGIGPGDPGLQIQENEKILAGADFIYGTSRQLDSVAYIDPNKKVVWDRPLSELKEEFASRLDYDLVYLASGDPMIYGIGPYFIRNFGEGRVRVYPGISSLQYIFSKIGISMNDAYLTSSHGRDPDFDLLTKLPKVAMVTDKDKGPYYIGRELMKRGREGVMYIGENLSYPDEKITRKTLDEVEDRSYGLAVVVVLDEG